MPQHRRSSGVSRRLHSSQQIDYVFLAIVLVLCMFGLLMLYDASVVVAARLFDDKFRFVTQQLMYLGIGLVALLVTSRVDYHLWQRLAPLMLLGAMVLLFAVFVPGLGFEALGARRWLRLGDGLTLQPSYLLCFALIAYLASWLSQARKDEWSLWGTYRRFGVLMGIIIVVVAFLQRDLGSAAILTMTGLIMYFLAGGPLWQIGTTVGVGLGFVGILVALEPYRMGRITAFLDRSNDALGTSYHINQALIALGSGGLLGLGIGQSRQKYSYLPEVQSDSIFAIIGEELGFVGTFVVVSAFVFLIWRGFKIAMAAPDTFGKLLVGGIVTLIGVQVFVNLFAIAALIPLTGIPLPFFSSGGTSLIVLLASVGIILNVSKQAE